MKEIIEADIDPKKEVLCLRASSAPTPTQQIMLSNLGQGGRPCRRSLRPTLTPRSRCYASGQHLLPLPLTNFFVKFVPRRETMNAFDSSRHIN